MKMTLLEIVRHILSSTDLEDVNSINDTEDAQQVAEIVKGAYIDLAAKINPQTKQELFELTSSSDTSLPVVMYVPDGVVDVLWVKYNKKRETSDINYQVLDYLPLEEFLRRSHSLDYSKSNVGSFDYTNDNGDTITVLYETDKHPDYYTTVDDNTLFFDSIDTTYSSVLRNDDTIAYGKFTPEFQMDDTWEIPFSDVNLSLLLQEVKSRAFVEILQTENRKAERTVSVLSAIQKASDPKVKGKHYGYDDGLPNYGRLPRR